MPHPLSNILRFQILPWIAQHGSARFIVAQPKMGATQMPPHVKLRRRKILGPRVIVRNRRYYNKERSVLALWPDTGLNEVSTPKFACVLRGHVDYQLGQYAVRCGAGHFLFIPPGMPHSDGSESYADKDRGGVCELLFFVAYQSAIECWVSHWDKQGYRLAGKYLLMHKRATTLLHTLFEEITSGDDHSLAIGEKLLSGFFLLLLREVEAGQMQPIRSRAPLWVGGEKNPETQSGDFKTQLHQHIQTNLQKPMTLESVAREMLFSRTQFIRLVRRETGQSFNEFLSAHRIAEAKQLLQNSQWTIDSISYFVGFKSPSYFRTFFRGRTGQTPSRFRTQSRQGESASEMSDS